MDNHKVMLSRGAYRELFVAFRRINPNLAVLLDGSIDLSLVGSVIVTCPEVEAILGPLVSDDTSSVASPGAGDADEPPVGRPVRVVAEIPAGSCTEKELAHRLTDVLRFPIKVMRSGGQYIKVKPVFKSYGRVRAAEAVKERQHGGR